MSLYDAIEGQRQTTEVNVVTAPEAIELALTIDGTIPNVDAELTATIDGLELGNFAGFTIAQAIHKIEAWNPPMLVREALHGRRYIGLWLPLPDDGSGFTLKVDGEAADPILNPHR